MKRMLAVRHRLVLVMLVTVVIAGCASASKTSASSPSGAVSAPVSSGGASPAARATGPAFLGTKYPSQGHTHLNPGEPDDFVYNSNPPTSGPHREIFNGAFVSSTPLPTYVQVHLLEHGNVLLQYGCICPDVAAALEKIAMHHDQLLLPPSQPQATAADVQNAEDQGRAVIVAPYPRMQSRIALSAWTYLGVLQSVDGSKIESFINAHLGNPTE